MLFSHAVAESVETSNDSSVFPESASNYGTWDVPKTYLHLYTENKITMNLRLPLSVWETALQLKYRQQLIKSMYRSSGAGSMYQMIMNTAVLILDYTGLPLVMIPAMIC